ncbi:MAG: GPW/gp25 family protein [Chitinophagales bacterium]|nr:GPW/gp25 family protein [Chitinophagales bacterium]
MNSFLGRGWSFPPSFNREGGRTNMLEDEDDIRSSLEILLSTVQGERIMQPTYGCDLTPLLFEPLTTSLRTEMVDKIRNAILYFEPRIDVEKIELKDDQILEGIVLITIDYVIRSTNSRNNFVFPFYRAEGTDITK